MDRRLGHRRRSPRRRSWCSRPTTRPGSRSPSAWASSRTSRATCSPSRGCRRRRGRCRSRRRSSWARTPWAQGDLEAERLHLGARCSATRAAGARPLLGALLGLYCVYARRRRGRARRARLAHRARLSLRIQSPCPRTWVRIPCIRARFPSDRTRPGATAAPYADGHDPDRAGRGRDRRRGVRTHRGEAAEGGRRLRRRARGARPRRRPAAHRRVLRRAARARRPVGLPRPDRAAAALDELGLETFARYREGESVYVGPDGAADRFTGDIFPASERDAGRDRADDRRARRARRRGRPRRARGRTRAPASSTASPGARSSSSSPTTTRRARTSRCSPRRRC